EVAAQEFLLFPTVAHSHTGRVRREHRHLLEEAAADSTDDHLVLRAAAKVVAAGSVARPDRLAVLVVQTMPRSEPLRVVRIPEYAGCTSWVQLPVTPALGAPVHDEAALL